VTERVTKWETDSAWNKEKKVHENIHVHQKQEVVNGGSDQGRKRRRVGVVKDVQVGAGWVSLDLLVIQHCVSMLTGPEDSFSSICFTRRSSQARTDLVLF
jgi:hypothetical protein